MAAFSALSQLATPEQMIWLRIRVGTGNSVERTGILRELFPDGLILETDGEMEYVGATEIEAWRLPKAPVPTKLSPILTPTSQPQNSIHSQPEKQQAQSPPVDALASPSPSPEDLEFQFAGEPILLHPTPSFDIPEIGAGVRKEIDRWRNRYQYAEKVREPARMAQDVPHVAELADSLNNPDLFFLAGSFAHISGLGAGRSRPYYKAAVERGSRQAAIALASLAIDQNEWQKAAESLLSALLITGEFGDNANLIRVLGQCLLRIPDKHLPGLGNLLARNLHGPAQRLAANLIAVVVKDDTEAYRMALLGDAEGIRRTEAGKNLFRIEQKQHQPLSNTNGSAPSKKGGFRQGRVSAFYPERKFGFIVEDTTGQTWFFHSSSVDDDSLLSGLVKSEVRQYVRFSGDPETVSGKYPLANTVQLISADGSILGERQERAPLKVRLAGIPKDGSFYARAKKAEQLDQLNQAESFYREEISRNGRHVKSAIKDLAALRSRIGKPESAIEVLKQYRSKYSALEQTSLDQMTVQFLVKARRFTDASQLLVQLAKKEVRSSKRLELLRQEAYCHFASGNFDIAIEKLDKLLRDHPYDNATLLLIGKVRQAKESGSTGEETARMADDVAEGDESLASLALGLSALARRHLDNCELRGIDARARENEEYSRKDYRQVKLLLEGLKGRRPRERADYLLTLAALCEIKPDLSEDERIHVFLRRHFLAVAEAAMSEHAPVDVVRCYAIESLFLCPAAPQPDTEPATTLEAALVILLGTYCSDGVEPSTLLKPEAGKRLSQLIEHFVKYKDDWQRFLLDAPYYKLRSSAALAELEKQLQKVLVGLPVDTRKERVRINEEEAAFHALFTNALSVDRLRTARELLAQCVHQCRFELDRQRLLEAVRIFSDSADYALERHFRERETRHLRLEADIKRYLGNITQLPTHLSIEKLYPVLSSLLAVLHDDFARADTARPALDIRNVLDNDFYVVNEGLVSLRLLLTSRDESAPPIEAIDLLPDGGNADPCHSPEPLHGGQSRELELAVRPSEEQIADGAFTVNITVQYRSRSGVIERLEPQALPVRLGSTVFEPIKNDYSRYSGGSPVEDESMFFGRKSLINRVVEQLSVGDAGQCFVLYGQKRSGKSSVLKQVEKRLATTALFASISAGTFDPSSLWTSFARLFVQELEFRLEDKSGCLPENWPTRTDVEHRPVETIRGVSRLLRKLGHSLIVAIDEFTYIFENSKSGVEEFMRCWKALLEAKTFNALLIGQDTMPRFKQAYPNEFGVTHDERISYLDMDEAYELATRPILLDNKTRYRGQALQRLFDLTAGSPFFLQIVCDHLVRHLNSRRAPFVTEADIEQVRHRLTVGKEALPPERFDALVTAAGEKVAIVPRDDLWRLLARVAKESLHSGWCYRNAIADLPRANEATKDLVDREVLATEGDRVSIRVGLFASWLRANQ